MFVFGLILGVLVGAAILYITQGSKLKNLEIKLRQTRRELDKSEAEFQAQMQQTIAYLRQAYDRESVRKNEETIQQYQKEIRNLKHEHQLQLEKLQEKETNLSETIVSSTSFAEPPLVPFEAELEDDLEFPFEAFSDNILDAEEDLEDNNYLDRDLNDREDLASDSEVEANKAAIEIPLATLTEKLQDFIVAESPIAFEELNLGNEAEDDSLSELAFLLSDKPKISFEISPKTPPKESVTPPASSQVEKSPEATIDRLNSMQTVDCLPQLSEHIYDRSPQVRATVATTIGKIAETNNIRAKIGQCLPVFEKLLRDNDISVRRAAITALDKIRSEKIIPLIRLALKDSDSEVVRLASSAIGRFRVYPNSNKPAKKNTSAKK